MIRPIHCQEPTVINLTENFQILIKEDGNICFGTTIIQIKRPRLRESQMNSAAKDLSKSSPNVTTLLIIL